jgi:hypothetical protein
MDRAQSATPEIIRGNQVVGGMKETRLEMWAKFREPAMESARLAMATNPRNLSRFRGKTSQAAM